MVAEILQWLALLDKEEHTQLLKFINSPFFNSTKELKEIYISLRKHLEKGKAPEDWEEQAAAEKIYKTAEKEVITELPVVNGHGNIQEQSKNIIKLRKHLARLRQLLPQFVAHLELKNKDASRQQVLLSALSRRPDKALFEAACDDYERMLDTSILDADQYGNLAWLHRERHSYQTAERFAPNPEYLLAANEYLDRHYLALKLRHITESLIAENIFKEKSKLAPIAPAVLQLAQNYYDTDLLVRSYTDLIYFLQHGFEEQRFRGFQDTFFRNKTNLLPKEQQAITKLIVNFLYNTWISNKFDLIETIVRWFKKALEDDKYSDSIILINQKISEDVFLNIACASAVMGDSDFTEFFIKNYSRYLDKKKRILAECIAEAYNLLHRQEYEKALKVINKHLNKLRKAEPKYNLRSRTVKLRSLLALYILKWDYYEEFLKEKDAFWQYLKRDDSFVSSRMDAYQNFLLGANDIFQYKKDFKTNGNSKTDLREKINSYHSMVAKDWMLGIIDSL